MLILVVALFVVGPSDLVRLARFLGRVLRKAAAYRDDLVKVWEREENLAQMHQVLQNAALENGRILKALQDEVASIKH